MKQLQMFVWACITMIVLAACQPKDKELEIDSQPPIKQKETASQTSTQVATTEGNQVSGTENNIKEPLRNDRGVIVDEMGIPTNTVFYFEFDRSSLNANDLDILASHGQYIADSANARVRLEGHTDERGAREYNVALGENRAKAVERILQLQGVRPSQISVLSFGEEQPADDGHTESSWVMNRRVEIVYESR